MLCVKVSTRHRRGFDHGGADPQCGRTSKVAHEAGAIVGGCATAGFHAIHRNAHAFQSYSGRNTEALQRNVGSAGFLTGK